MASRFLTFPLRLVPDETNINFISQRKYTYVLSLILLIVTIFSLAYNGLNMGIDFKGGILIEAKSTSAIDIATMRSDLDAFDIGEVSIQSIGSDQEVMINVQQQETIQETNAATKRINDYLKENYEVRRVELVGPKVGDELFRNGMIATAFAILAITIYVAFRFEWQFGVSALIGTFHDVFITIGLFSVLDLEFSLTAIAALLTLAGYSINDTVIVFDRMRENLKKYKNPDLKQIINTSVNQTLSRTILTSLTTLIAILPLLLFGGPNLFDFTLALTWGIFIGTYSSIFVSAPLLLFMKPLRRKIESNS